MSIPYHHGNLRTALLQAARARLADSDASELSLRELAASVGVTVNACYRHFKNKDALLMELAASGFDELREAMQHAIDTKTRITAAKKLRLAGAAYAEFARREPALFRLMFARKGQFDGHERYKAAGRAAFVLLIECIGGVAGPRADSKRVMPIAIAAWSLVHGYATLGLNGYLDEYADVPGTSAGDVVMMLKTVGSGARPNR